MPKYTLQVRPSSHRNDVTNSYSTYHLMEDGKLIAYNSSYNEILKIMDQIKDFENRYSDEKSEFVNKVKGK